MSTNELLLLLIALASAGGGFAVAKTTKSSPTPQNPPPAPPNPPPTSGDASSPPAATRKEDPEKDSVSANKSWHSSMLDQWAGAITALGTAAALLATYEVTKDLGKGDLGTIEGLLVLAGAAAFATGIALLLMIPISLRARSKVLIADALKRQQKLNDKAKPPGARSIVPSSSLFGYRDILEFDAANEAVVQQARACWLAGDDPPPELKTQIRLFAAQRRRVERLVATVELRHASRRAVRIAIGGITLAVLGFSAVSLLTNEGIRAGELADARVAHERALEVKVVDDALAAPGAVSTLPTTPSPVTVAFPDAARAASVLGSSDALPKGCWAARQGTALDMGEPPPGVPPGRQLFVAFSATEQCSPGAGWVKLSWRQAQAESAEATTPGS